MTESVDCRWIILLTSLLSWFLYLILINDYYDGWWLITLHSTVTWLTLTRSLGGSYGQIKTLTLYSDPNPFPNQNPTPNPNEKFDLLPYIAMSRDVTWPKQFLPITFQGRILILRHVGWFWISVQKYVDWTWC